MTPRTYTWSPIISLHDYLQAPNTPGIYEIGFKKPGYLAPQYGNIGSFGLTYPADFHPMYSGKHEASIRKRLGEHFVGINSAGNFRSGTKANSYIRDYYRSLDFLRAASVPAHLEWTRGGLFFTCLCTSDPAAIEAYYRLNYFEYSWNKKTELSAAERAAAEGVKDLAGLPSKICHMIFEDGHLAAKGGTKLV